MEDARPVIIRTQMSSGELLFDSLDAQGNIIIDKGMLESL